MANPAHHGPSVLIVASGAHPSLSGDGKGAAGGGKAVIPVPKGFDLGDAKPGDKLDVTAHCRVSPDGEHLIVLSVDDGEADDDDQNDASEAGDGDDSSTPGDRWDKAVNSGK